MNCQDVRIIELPAMRVASALGFGEEPEAQAWEIIRGFAANHGIDLGDKAVITYGFNNPAPTPGNDRYGYEIWLPVDAGVPADAPVEIKDVPCAKYAVTRFTGLSNIGRAWKELVAWFEDSPYTQPPNWHQCLEALRNPLEADPEKFLFELYLPLGD